MRQIASASLPDCRNASPDENTADANPADSAPGVRKCRISGLNPRFRCGDFCFSRNYGCLRLLDSGILQFFLASIVDQRAVSALKRGFSLRNLRPKIVVLQASQ